MKLLVTGGAGFTDKVCQSGICLVFKSLFRNYLQ
ncbi:MAG: hypothetical protein UT61_C0042G0002 [Candidatus Woesebacteria bacterium GW2011_GWA1_39_8]|uniref:Uncharacterized protein n=1 Tax=Candidatus Woesebacteria bacterium GW2011_GWA1_39_8 TaxID=1618552 RepID=A0A0G0ST71_9BACT|nr:MAG: hypothetical protein UT61_C0042G0002 [Candidatus Woesebacteria bacterium GW2011_GWA1_39_8]